MKSVGFVIPRVILGGIFIVSGYQKLMEGSAVFAAVIRSYEIVGGPIAEGMAAGLPWVELVLGVFLVLGLWRRAAILGLWAFNMAFIAALLSAIVRKIPLENCGCFGNGSGIHFTPVQALIFDLFLWVLFAVAWRLRAKGPSLDKVFDA